MKHELNAKRKRSSVRVHISRNSSKTHIFEAVFEYKHVTITSFSGVNDQRNTLVNAQTNVLECRSYVTS
jgi:predicted AAA+ superfamily ATPase